MASELVKEFTDANFESEVLKSDKVVLVDFWAEWCQPCIRLNDVIQSVARKFNGAVKIGKVDIEANRDLSTRRFDITSIPTLMIFQPGKATPAKILMGYQREEMLIQALTEAGAPALAPAAAGDVRR